MANAANEGTLALRVIKMKIRNGGSWSTTIQCIPHLDLKAAANIDFAGLIAVHVFNPRLMQGRELIAGLVRQLQVIDSEWGSAIPRVISCDAFGRLTVERAPPMLATHATPPT